MNDKPTTLPGWNLLGPGNNGTPTDKAAERLAPMSAEAPLSGEWRASQFYVCCGTLRIFRIDIDTDPSAEFTDSLMRWVVERLNASEQAAEIAVLRHDLADERRRWPECDKHRTGEPDARRGHCAQCGVEREKSKDAEIRRLKSLAKEIANDLTDDAVSLNAARKDLAAAQATIAEMREELIRARANSETLKRMMADTVGIAAMKDRIAALEAEKVALEKERLTFAEKCFIAGCESADERISYDYAHGRWQTSYLRSDLISEQTALAPDLSTSGEWWVCPNCAGEGVAPFCRICGLGALPEEEGA